MTTKDLINDIAERSGIRKADVADLLGTMSDVVTENLLSGRSVMIQNFGSFEVKTRNERVSVHPKTGERKTIPAKQQISFKPNSTLKEELKTIKP